MGILIAGFIGGLRTVFGIAALAILIMPAGLNDNGRLLVFLMIGAMVSGVIMTRYSSYKNVISQPQDGPTVLISVFAAVYASEKAPPDLAVAIILATVAVASIFTGLVFYLIGQWRLGLLVRFIPYPVIGGFLAGSGLLITLSALSILTNQKISQLDIGLLINSGSGSLFIFGILLAGILIKLPPLFKSRLVFPMILVLTTLLFHLYFHYQQIPISELQSSGWLVTPKQQINSTAISFWFDISFDAWVFLASNILTFVAIAVISVVTMLLNLSGLEIATRSEFDFNRELKIAGVSSMVGGLFGGCVSFPALSASLLGQQMKVDSRWVGYVSYGIILIVLLLGTQSLGFVPKPILGALLLCVGFYLLDVWLFKGYKQFSRIDYFTVLTITAVMTGVGYLPGVATGILLCGAFFVWSYSQTKVIALELSGVHLRSNIDRPAFENKLLESHGGEIRFLKIEGFLFFGTAQSVYDRVSKLSKSGVFYFIFDMSQVKSIDSSAFAVLERISNFCQDNSCILQFTRVNSSLTHISDFGNILFKGALDRDHSLEYCENLLIEKHKEDGAFSDKSVWTSITSQIHSVELLESFKSYFSIRKYSKGDYLVRRNEVGNEMFLIESGRFEALIESEGIGSNEIRLRVFTVGSIIGETVIYSVLKRTASVRAGEDSVVYVMTKARLDDMEREFPNLGNALHRAIISMMAERLLASNRLVEQLNP